MKFSFAWFFFNVEIFFIFSLVFFLCFYIYVKHNQILNTLLFLNKGLFENRFFSFLGKIIISYGFLIFLIIFLLLCSLYEKNFYLFFSYYNDEFIIFIKFFVLLMSFFVLKLSYNYLSQENIFRSFEFMLLFFFSILSIFFVISSNELIFLYISIEMLSLLLYVLASAKQNSILSIESGLKYFILGTVSSGFLLFSSALIYGLLGTTKFNEILILLQSNFFFSFDFNNLLFELFSHKNYLINLCSVTLFSIMFFFIPFFFKLSAAPFHIWTPDVYEGAPTLVTFFFSIVPKFLFLGLFSKICYNVFFFSEISLTIFIFFCCMFSLIIGSFLGIFQTKTKRLLAYSTIANIGFILIGVFSETLEGLSISFLYLLIYSLSTILIFVILITVRYYNNWLKLKNIFEYANLLNMNPILSFFLVLSLFSLIGIPPLSGFFSKLFLFFITVLIKSPYLLLIGLVSSAVSAFYYLRLIRIILFKKNISFIFLIPLPEITGILLFGFLLFNLLFLWEMNFFFKFFYNFNFFFISTKNSYLIF
jgi:NADH-quinone oxidoreductase subunit N